MSQKNFTNGENDSLVKQRESISRPSENSPPINGEHQESAKDESMKESSSTEAAKFYENVWRATFVVISIIGLVLVERVYRFHNDPNIADVPKGSIYDFWVSIVVAIIVGVIRHFIKVNYLARVILLLSEKRSHSPEQAQKRAEQICKWLFDFCYYILSSVCGYLLVKDQPFLPPLMLGHGNCSNLFMGYPRVPEIPYLRLFYLIQGGSHLHTFLYQIIVKRNETKFYEYALHHSLALFLIWFSYMMNFLLIGVIVLLIHDPSDVLLIATRIYTDMKNRILAVNIAIFLMSYPLWVYSRNIIFPTCVIKSSYDFYLASNEFNSQDYLTLPSIFMLAMLCILALMHLYWTIFFTKAIISMLTKGKDKNGYDS